VTTSDGVTTSVAQLQAQQARTQVDPVAMGARAQLEFQRDAISNAKAAADMNSSDPKSWVAIYNASLQAAGVNNFSGNQVQLSGQQGQERTAANRLAQEAPEAAAKGAGAQGTLNAQDAYAKALASGDATKIAAAEAQLRGRLGKFEKDTPDLFDRVQTGVDSATGAPIFSIYSKRTGQVSEQPAGAKAPKYEPGKLYQDAKGNKAKWDGQKFVPA
jgi:hypothetical protein